MRRAAVTGAPARRYATGPDVPAYTEAAYYAEPGSPSADALRLLASWGTDATRAGAGMPPARTA
ncbi:hypothetical protein BOG92_050505 [Streptomyces sp. WAC00263]|nr:hypothetical protein BOG92_050505 [Streptomyces sp. WAC00263]